MCHPSDFKLAVLAREPYLFKCVSRDFYAFRYLRRFPPVYEGAYTRSEIVRPSSLEKKAKAKFGAGKGKAKRKRVKTRAGAGSKGALEKTPNRRSEKRAGGHREARDRAQSAMF